MRPRNKEQSFALDLLLDDSIRLVTIMGKAGTGKTLLGDRGRPQANHRRRRVRAAARQPPGDAARARPRLPAGRREREAEPWMQPIYDNLESCWRRAAASGAASAATTTCFIAGSSRSRPLTYIRGRSLPQQFVIVDEAQNLTPHEVKTVITRCGEGRRSCSPAIRTKSTIPTWTARPRALGLGRSPARREHRRAHRAQPRRAQRARQHRGQQT